MRNIHDRSEIYKFFGLVVVTSAQETIFNNMTKFQMACKPGHRSSEHLFVLCNVISLFKEQKKGFLVLSFDLKMFFDFEEISDVMDSLYRRNIRGKLYRLLYNMNQKVKIKVTRPEVSKLTPGARRNILVAKLGLSKSSEVTNRLTDK